jgi:hypothetical protein
MRAYTSHPLSALSDALEGSASYYCSTAFAHDPHHSLHLNTMWKTPRALSFSDTRVTHYQGARFLGCYKPILPLHLSVVEQQKRGLMLGPTVHL